MQKFSQNQRLIAHALFSGSKTVEELKEQLSIPLNDLSAELKKLLKLNLVNVSGYPAKYALEKEIQKELERRKEISLDDSNKLRLKIIIEAQAILKESTLSSLKQVEKALREEADFTVYDIVIAQPIKQDEKFSSYLEANLSVKDFKALVRLMYFFGPTSVEVLKPKKLEVSIEDLQDGLGDMAEMIQAYNYYILKLMNKKELEQFQKRLFG